MSALRSLLREFRVAILVVVGGAILSSLVFDVLRRREAADRPVGQGDWCAVTRMRDPDRMQLVEVASRCDRCQRRRLRLRKRIGGQQRGLVRHGRRV